MPRARALTAGAALLAATAAVVWWLGSPEGVSGAHELRSGEGAGAASAQNQSAARPVPSRPMENSFFAARRASADGESTDPLLAEGLRDTLEALLQEALEDGGASDPAALKQRLAGLVGKHFPAALAARALALAERYVDYRVALGQLRPPKDPTDPGALREALEARHQVRRQFFDGPEHDALFAREAELDRYTLARLEIERNPNLTPAQRGEYVIEAGQVELFGGPRHGGFCRLFLARLAQLPIEQFPAEVDGSLRLLLLDPLADLLARARRFHKSQPVPGRLVTRIGDDFDRVPVLELF